MVKGDEIVGACDRQSNETVILGKHVTKYTHMRKWIVEFLSKSESCGNKIARTEEKSLYYHNHFYKNTILYLLCEKIYSVMFL